MKRSQPLRPTGRLRRRAALRAKGGSRFPKRRDPDYCAWIRTLPCAVIYAGDCAGRIECAHVTSRGAGGKDVGNTFAACTRHHREQHRIGISSFEAKYTIDLAAWASWLPYERSVGPGCRPTPARGRDQ